MGNLISIISDGIPAIDISPKSTVVAPSTPPTPPTPPGEYYGDESDGDLIVSGTANLGIDTDLISDVATDSTTISVRDSSEFTEGMYICLHQTQCFRDNTKARRGAFEFSTIDTVNSPTSITLTTGTTNSYLSDAGGDKDLNTKTQIFKVYQFKSLTIGTGVTLSANSWDGYSGGNLIIKCKALNGLGTLSTASRGYRGIVATDFCGEGFLGTCRSSFYSTFSGAQGGQNSFAGHKGIGQHAGTGTPPPNDYGWTTDEVKTNILTWGGAASTRYTFQGNRYSGGGLILYVEDDSGFTGEISILGGNSNSGGDYMECSPGMLKIYTPTGTYAGTVLMDTVYGWGEGYYLNAIPTS